MNMKKNNKGFSLVELIIVIAIMAILVAVLVPVLLKQLEKAKISSDLEVLTTICAAIEYGMVDQGIMDDPASRALAAKIDNTVSSPMRLCDLDAEPDCFLKAYILETCSLDDLSAATLTKRLKAKYTDGNNVYFSRRGSAINPIVMWVTGTDRECKGRQPAAPSNYRGITCEIAID